MKQLYTGSGQRTEDGWRNLDSADPGSMRKPEGYVAQPDLVAAVNVALTLGQPLLLTGEPGTGKTQLAYSLAWELGFDKPLKFETKSTTESRDLFYTFDTVGRFHAAQAHDRPVGLGKPRLPSSGSSGGAVDAQDDESIGPADPLRFITYNALGLAIILANERDTVSRILPPGFKHPGPRRSVVLIDEIDKAPRDVPNDVLSEIETMSFRVPELNFNGSIGADSQWRPVVIITSNSEKALPDAFLRRCIYYHVPFPEAQLPDIVASRIGSRFKGLPLLTEALSLFAFLRDPALNLRKPPATAELLDWLRYLQQRPEGLPATLIQDPQLHSSFRTTLLKNKDDQERADDLMKRWRARPVAAQAKAG
jgi:MoxR-like ATPase